MSSSKTSFGTNLKSSVKAGLRFTKWVWQDVRSNPGLALYARRQHCVNQRFFEHEKKAAQVGAPTFLHNYEDVPTVPKTIWMFWAQGEANAPPVVRQCIASWRRHNPNWDVRILSDDSIDDLVDMDDLPDVLPRRFKADLLRLRLLKAHGGVWADATVFCHRPLEDWLPLQASSGFFVFSNPGPDRWLSTWFIATYAASPLISSWEQTLTDYACGLTERPKIYFMVMYAFQWAVSKDVQLQAAWDRCARLPAPPTFLLMAALEGRLPMCAAQEMISRGLPVSKLSWKSDVDPAQIEAVLNGLATEHG